MSRAAKALAASRKAASFEGLPEVVRSRVRGRTVLALAVCVVFSAGCGLFAPSIKDEPVDDYDESLSTPPIPRSVPPEKEVEAPPEVEEVEPVELDEHDPSRLVGPAFESGVGAARQGQWQVAEELFEQVVEYRPEHKWGWYNLGVVRDRGDDEQGAINAWRAALDIDGDFAPAAVNLARLLVRQDQARAAERMLRDLIDRHPANLDLRNELASVMAVQGTPAKLDAAFDEARQVLSVDEQNVGALLVLAKVFSMQEMDELSEWVVQRVLALEPDNPTAHHILGFLQLRQDRGREAFSSFRSAASARSESAEVYVNYGALLNQAHDFEAAIEQLEKAVEYAPRMAEAHLNLGNAYRGVGRHEDALKKYRRALELDEDNPDPLMNKALVYLDAPLEDMEVLERLEKAKGLLEAYRGAGGDDDRFSDFMRDAERAIAVEERRLERETLRLAREEEEARQRAEEEAAEREREEAARLAEEQERLAEEAERARREAEEEAGRRARDDEDRRAKEAEQARRAAEEEAARRSREDEDRRAREAEQARRAAEEAARKDGETGVAETLREDEDDEEEDERARKDEEDEEEEEEEEDESDGDEPEKDREKAADDGAGSLLGEDGF